MYTRMTSRGSSSSTVGRCLTKPKAGLKGLGSNIVGRVKKDVAPAPFNFYLRSSASRRSWIFFKTFKMGSRALSESLW